MSATTIIKYRTAQAHVASGAMSTSVDAMPVARVRRALAQLRRAWDEHAPDNPIFPSDLLHNAMTMERFAFIFVLSHHEKRHLKSNMRRSRSSEVAEEGSPPPVRPSVRRA